MGEQTGDATSPGSQAAIRDALIAQTRSYLTGLLVDSDTLTDGLVSQGFLRAYFDQPRITIVSAQVTVDKNDPTRANLAIGVDLRRDSIRGVLAPGQVVEALRGFQVRGVCWRTRSKPAPSPTSSRPPACKSVRALAPAPYSKPPRRRESPWFP